MSEFVLKLQDLTAEGRHYDMTLSPQWINTALEGSELWAKPDAPPGHLELDAQRSGADVLVRGQLQAELVTTCSRCLQEALLPVRAVVTALFTARGERLRPEPDELELTPEDLEREFFTGEQIVLDGMVREHLMLECPMQPLCSESCPGIDMPGHLKDGQTFDSDGAKQDAVDPRLAPLAEIAQKLGRSED